MKLLILTALPSELDGARAPAGARVIYTGVGKVKTAVAATEAILADRPDLVVNYGTAGKVDERLHGLVEVRGVTPLSSDPFVIESGFGEVVCGTGDSLIGANRQFKDWLRSKGVQFTELEVADAGHVWPLWRQNVADMVPRLFRKPGAAK